MVDNKSKTSFITQIQKLSLMKLNRILVLLIHNINNIAIFRHNIFVVYVILETHTFMSPDVIAFNRTSTVKSLQCLHMHI